MSPPPKKRITDEGEDMKTTGNVVTCPVKVMTARKLPIRHDRLDERLTFI